MDGTYVGAAGARLEGIGRIAVLRGGGLGDLMFAVPACEALAAAYPEAALTLLGTPAHAELLAGRPGPVDEVVVVPPAPGVRPGEEDPQALAAFFRRMREREFDLAVQVHGGGRNSNPFLLELGARHTVGTRTEDAAALERNLPYVYHQHEMLRALEVVGLVGAPVRSPEARLAVTPAEREAGAELRDEAAAGLLVLHPGATDPRRRWPAERFAELAALAEGEGWQVLVVGDGSDAPAGEEIVSGARSRGSRNPRGSVASLAGALSLSALMGVLAEADVMVGNDSGPRHLAAAAGTATVGLYWVGNCISAGPLGRGRHRVHLSWVTRCPECGVDVTQVGWTADRCAHDPSYLTAIAPEPVWADARALAAGR
ncbi:glycosyltransferase family 9 protein [Brevibacterium salitolerans]|uniref:Glycosyltransferase family 9 protein n=1 Tax=Brevibacterium salitolerans TaxID=1403566 RepID=A0ABN2WG17_9MICO